MPVIVHVLFGLVLEWNDTSMVECDSRVDLGRGYFRRGYLEEMKEGRKGTLKGPEGEGELAGCGGTLFCANFANSLFSSFNSLGMLCFTSYYMIMVSVYNVTGERWHEM